MKKTKIVFSVVLLVLILFALSSCMEPLPEYLVFSVNDYHEVDYISIFGIDGNGNENIIESVYIDGEIDLDHHHGEETKDPNERIYSFLKKVDTQQLYFEVHYKDGRIEITNSLEAKDLGAYTYNTQTGEFKNELIRTTMPDDLTQWLYWLLIAVAVGLSVIFEWIASFPFKIKNYMRILITSCISSCIIGTVPFLICSYFIADFVLMVVIAEIIAFFIKFYVYKKYIKDISQTKLIIYTCIATVISFMLLFGFKQFLLLFADPWFVW